MGTQDKNKIDLRSDFFAWICIPRLIQDEGLEQGALCEDHSIRSTVPKSTRQGTATRTIWTSTVAQTSAGRATSLASSSRKASRPSAPTLGSRNGMSRGKQVRFPPTSQSE